MNLLKKALLWIGGIIVVIVIIAAVASGGGDKASTSSQPNQSTQSTKSTDQAQTKPGFTIKVTGTDGLEFSGNYMIVTSDGKTASKSVEGKIPAEYQVDGAMVSVSFQKKVEKGKLKVEILKGDKVMAESDTDAAYGVVSASTH